MNKNQEDKKRKERYHGAKVDQITSLSPKVACPIQGTRNSTLQYKDRVPYIQIYSVLGDIKLVTNMQSGLMKTTTQDILLTN